MTGKAQQTILVGDSHQTVDINDTDLNIASGDISLSKTSFFSYIMSTFSLLPT